MALSQFFILSSKGDKLVYKDYRHDVPKFSDEIFFGKYKFWDGGLHQAPPGECPPFFCEQGINFCFVRRRQLFFVVTTRENASPSTTVEILLGIVKLIRDFLGVLSEESVRRNFTLIYELMDEIMDLGIPQEMRTDRLRPYILHAVAGGTDEGGESLYDRLLHAHVGGEVDSKKGAAAAVSVLRNDDGSKNEIYVDLIERLNAVFAADGRIVKVDVDGSLMVKSFLAGDPTVYVTLNDNLVVSENNAQERQQQMPLSGSAPVDSIAFHEDTDHTHFDRQKLIIARPPVGETTMLSYRSTSPSIHLPFHLIQSLEVVSELRAELYVRLRADLPASVAALCTSITVPLPSTTVTASADFGGGAADQSFEYREGVNEFTWSIPSFAGGTERICKIGFSTSAPLSATDRTRVGPISMFFEIPHQGVTGVTVQSLRVEGRDGNDKPKKWIRVSTQASAYTFRTH
ncbi:AP-4 complex subunit mu-1 [Strigomonas culicis]|uniref:AP-4 complex subunit mu-1 n=1 Tax=Strigomonas culicis TaxID=28005 RepID=S9UB41_9TRYP|nr:AP-4 complex subunit mu-1 [Strigomonas culicis]EPY29182.1 AP-4 complex subunit mu-1 [Strigomonas culicis]EPY35910.1 AP-4 complex subunit mu-1 [Strigomonas culicis]|eukprot:EPY26138.1 AP-4 complex subunit mu-1 [Strigomonas culicis]